MAAGAAAGHGCSQPGALPGPAGPAERDGRGVHQPDEQGKAVCFLCAQLRTGAWQAVLQCCTSRRAAWPGRSCICACVLQSPLRTLLRAFAHPSPHALAHFFCRASSAWRTTCPTSPWTTPRLGSGLTPLSRRHARVSRLALPLCQGCSPCGSCCCCCPALPAAAQHVYCPTALACTGGCVEEGRRAVRWLSAALSELLPFMPAVAYQPIGCTPLCRRLGGGRLHRRPYHAQ